MTIIREKPFAKDSLGHFILAVATVLVGRLGGEVTITEQEYFDSVEQFGTFYSVDVNDDTRDVKMTLHREDPESEYTST